MKDLKTSVLWLPLLVTLSVSSLAQEKSLYDRLGGNNVINSIVDDFAGNIIADSRINKKFAQTDAIRFVTNLRVFICVITGGPCKYNGNDMKSAHMGMGVTEGEFNALIEDLVKTLDKFNIPPREKNELLGALASFKSLIVERNSSTTGTGLPTKFKPAPPLSSHKGSKYKRAKKVKIIPVNAETTEVKSISVDRVISISSLREALTKPIGNNNNNTFPDQRAIPGASTRSKPSKGTDTKGVNITLDDDKINRAAIDFYKMKYGSKMTILKEQNTIEVLIEGIKGAVSNNNNFWEKIKIQTYIFKRDQQAYFSIVIHGKCALGWNQPGDKDYKDIEDEFPGRLNDYADKLITDLTNYLKGENR